MQQNPQQPQMGQDVSGDVAGLISSAKVFGSSENFRHGLYQRLYIQRIFAQMVETDKGQHRMGFVEMKVLECEPNPQHEGDREGFMFTRQGESGVYTPGTGKLLDDGMNPNRVGASVALKVDFDGPGGRSAGSNIKAFILALFGKREGQVSDAEIDSTWRDLARQKPLKKGDAIGINSQNNTVIYSEVDKPANPACGMVIAMRTQPKRKKTPNDKGAYITKLAWECISPYGTGENAPDAVIKRRAEVEAMQGDDDDEDVVTPPVAASSMAALPVAPSPTMAAPPAPPPPVMAAPPPPSPPAAWTPPAPWHKPANHPGYVVSPDPAKNFYWNGTNAPDSVKSEAQLRAMGL